MNGRTHKNKKGGAWFSKKTVGAAEVEAHNNLPPDVRIGVLVSEKSLASDDSSIRGNPYVIILPQQFKEGDERYAYGSSAADAVSKAQQRQYQAARFPDDTYTGVGISSRNLVTPHPEMAKQPYVIQYTKEGEDSPVVEYGTSPAFIKRSSLYAATRRVAGKVGSAVAYGARGIGSAAAYGARGIGSAARGIGKGTYHAPGATVAGITKGVSAIPPARSSWKALREGAASRWQSVKRGAKATIAAVPGAYATAAPRQAAALAARGRASAKAALDKNPGDVTLEAKYAKAADLANQRASQRNHYFETPEAAAAADDKRDSAKRADDVRMKVALAKASSPEDTASRLAARAVDDDAAEANAAHAAFPAATAARAAAAAEAAKVNSRESDY